MTGDADAETADPPDGTMPPGAAGAAGAAPARPIRSFVLRAGRMGPGQQRALQELGPKFLLPFQAAPLDFEALFGRRAPLILEIGFGMGCRRPR